AELAGVGDRTAMRKRAEARSDEGRAAGGRGREDDHTTRGDVEESTLEQEVLIRSARVPVVVELRSERAPTAMTAMLSSLAEEARGQWVHATVDVDTSPGVAQAFQARAVPTVVAVAAGRPLADFEGEQPEDALRQWIAAVIQATEGKLEGPEEGDAPDDGGEDV